MKSKSLVITVTGVLFFLFGCQNITPKQARLNHMCDCMENSKEDLNNSAAKQLLGNAFMTAAAGQAALDCAQKIMEKENLNYTEMIQLFQDFSNSDCGKSYKLDDASINNSVQDATEDVNRIMQENSNK